MLVMLLILPSMADLLADAKAELYQADPEDFMSRRQELVARAREAGESAAAKQIGALRKPTRSAWVLNRLVRADPEVLHGWPGWPTSCARPGRPRTAGGSGS